MQHSTYAPGPVDDDETVARLIYFPQHVYEDGGLKAEAIPRQDLNNRGFSVYRKEFANYDQNQLRHIALNIEATLARNEKAYLEGVATQLCEIIRSITDNNGEQAFIVLDAATRPEDCAHAEIWFARNYVKSMQIKLRESLMRKLDKIRRAQEILNLPNLT